MPSNIISQMEQLDIDRKGSVQPPTHEERKKDFQ
jgi:hypothetical protein